MKRIDVSRTATLDAGLIFLKLLRSAPLGARAFGSQREHDETEARLRNDLANAQAALDSFRLSRAASAGLDAILPGWRDLDVSDFLPSSKWHTFVSNDKAEWVAWLVENGVPEKQAKGIITNQWGDE